MRPLEAPRTVLVFAGVGTLLWLVFGILDLASGAAPWRIVAYFLIAAVSLYMFIRAVSTLRRRRSSAP